jgi:hypothetical protein
MKTVWVYFAKEAHGDEKSDLIVFETEELAQRWLAEKDPGVSCSNIRSRMKRRRIHEPQRATPPLQTGPNKVKHPLGHGDWANAGGKAMKVLAASLTLLVSTAAAAAQECQMCSTADACIAAYAKATSEAQKATKVAIRDWHQNLDKKTSAEFSSRGTTALQNVLLSQVRSELDRLKECLAKIK